MTGYKFFKIDPDMFYMMDEEYFREDEDIKEQYKENRV